MAGIEHRHIVGFRQPVDGREQGSEVLFGIYIFFPVGGKQNITALCKPQPGVDIAAFDLREVFGKHLRHGGPGNENTLRRQAAPDQPVPRPLGIRHVYIRNHVHDPAVCFFRQAFILAAVARFHMEDGNMQPLRADHGKTGIGIAQHQNGVRLQLRHQCVAAGDDIAHAFAQIAACGVQRHVRRCEAQIAEKHAVQVIIIVLPRVAKQRIKARSAFFDHGGKPYDLGPRAHNDQQLQLSVILK